MRAAFNDDTPEDERTFARDYYWYLWCGPDSPLFDKSKMATFERYFIADTSTHKEEKGYYYKLRDNETYATAYSTHSASKAHTGTSSTDTSPYAYPVARTP
jgi:fructose-1,6-bisphosphatase